MDFQSRPDCTERKKRKKALARKRKKKEADRIYWLAKEDEFYNGF